MVKPFSELITQYIERSKNDPNYIESEEATFNKSLIKTAQMYALECISLDDVCYLLKCSKEDIPSEFFKYAELYGIKYDISMKLLQLTKHIEEQV